MVFSSLTFLCIFLPIVVILYGIFPVKWRNFLLLAASLVFYAWGEPRYILIMLFSTVFDYINGRLIEYYDMQQKQKAKKRVVMVSIVGNLGILAFFKYTDMLIESLRVQTESSTENVLQVTAFFRKIRLVDTEDRMLAAENQANPAETAQVSGSGERQPKAMKGE